MFGVNVCVRACVRAAVLIFVTASSATSSITSLWNAIQQMQQSANGASNLATEDALTTQPDVFFLVANGRGGVYDALHTSAQDYDDTALHLVPRIAAWAIALTVISITLTVFVILVIVKPSVWRVEDEKQEIIFLFMELPPAVLGKLIMKCQSRLSHIEKLANGGGREVADLDALDTPEEPTVLFFLTFRIRVSCDRGVGFQ